MDDPALLKAALLDQPLHRRIVGVGIDADNDWTIYTQDGKPSAQWEIQVLVTETGHEVLAW